MFSSDDINNILANSPAGYDLVLMDEMNIKPTCPDCGGDCKKETIEGDVQMWKCQGFCKTWVYRPEWIEAGQDEHTESE